MSEQRLQIAHLLYIPTGTKDHNTVTPPESGSNNAHAHSLTFTPELVQQSDYLPLSLPLPPTIPSLDIFPYGFPSSDAMAILRPYLEMHEAVSSPADIPFRPGYAFSADDNMLMIMNKINMTMTAPSIGNAKYLLPVNEENHDGTQISVWMGKSRTEAANRAEKEASSDLEDTIPASLKDHL